MKKWYKSKTIWVNVLAVALAVITYIEGADFLPEHVTTALVSVVLPVVNVGLRFLTNKPILKQPVEQGDFVQKCNGCGVSRH